MARIHEEIKITSIGRMPSLGDLLGTGTSSDIFDRVDNSGYSSFFGSEFTHMGQRFYDRHVRPLEELSFEIGRTVNMLVNPDRYRTLASIEDFRSIPTCMELPIVMFAPLRQALVEGRIEGFGYNPDSLPEEDVFGRMISNFACDDVAAASDENGEYEISAIFDSEDPDLSDDDLYHIRLTREYIKESIWKNTDRDPTAIDIPRG